VGARLVRLGGFRTQNAAEIDLADSAGSLRTALVVIPPEADPAAAERALSLAATAEDTSRADEVLTTTDRRSRPVAACSPVRTVPQNEGVADERRTEYREREDKYDVEPGFVLPDLSAPLPPGGRVEPAEFRLSSTYYDTAAADLRRNRLTLRRREGDTDTGWHLKLPASKATNNARTEVRLPDAPELPEQLARVLTGVRRGADLVPVARLVTRRTAHRLLDAEG
jgi:CYTH domain-containing protein